MSEGWLWWQSGAGLSAWNMACDEALLESAAVLGKPLLRFYAWSERAASFGYFQRYREAASWTDLRPLVRRPTGGGLVPHADDWTYSVVVPPGHPWYELKAVESYRRMHVWVSEALRTAGFSTELADATRTEAPGRCFMGAELFDVLWQGSKVAGAAQRRSRHGLLIQGSVQSMALNKQRNVWEAAMLEVGRAQFAVEWQRFEFTAALRARAAELAGAKYQCDAYHQKR